MLFYDKLKVNLRHGVFINSIYFLELKNTMKTSHAPAERASSEKIEKQKMLVAGDQSLKKILDAVPEAVLILNRQRQIIYINRRAGEIFDNVELNAILGLRPGDVLGCENAQKTKGGCGTTKSCAFCGAVNAILGSQKGNAVIEEARITLNSGGSLDLKVTAAPFIDGDEIFTVFSIADISDEKRRKILERTFFHDILNTASGLSGYSELMLNAGPDKMDEYKMIIHRLSRSIIDEINAQRMLIDAENETLDTMLVEVNSGEICQRIMDFYAMSSVAHEKSIVIDESSDNIKLIIDETLLSRVLGNMLKNALEASTSGSTVSMGCRRKDNRIEFNVANQGVMPEEVQAQIFKRSFTTKGTGRGIGTYSMKLLSEKYLNGFISFTSAAETGTIFTASFPLRPDSSSFS